MTRASRTITTEITGATRIPSSVNGNPRFVLHALDGDYTISSDASIGYEVSNFLGIISRTGGPILVTLSLTPAGRFFDIQEASR